MSSASPPLSDDEEVEVTGVYGGEASWEAGSV